MGLQLFTRLKQVFWQVALYINYPAGPEEGQADQLNQPVLAKYRTSNRTAAFLKEQNQISATKLRPAEQRGM